MGEPMKLNAEVFLSGRYLHIVAHGFSFAPAVQRPFAWWLIESGHSKHIAGDRYEVSAECTIGSDRIVVHIETACRVVFLDLDIALTICARQMAEDRLRECRRVEESAAIGGPPVQEEMFV